MKLTNKMFTLGAALCIGLTMAGCTTDSNGSTMGISDSGTLLLSVNPKIAIDYNSDGLTTNIRGINDDGKTISSTYGDFVGKPVETVVSDLIDKIHANGFLSTTIDGNQRNIIIQIEAGSTIPDDDFIETLTTTSQAKVDALALSNDVVDITTDDYDPRYTDTNTNVISLDKAKEIALAQANVDPASALFTKREYDFDDGAAIYELEFVSNGIEYEYDVYALDGTVVKATHHGQGTPSVQQTTDYHTSDYGLTNDGITDYDNTDYGPHNDGVTNYDDTDYGPNNDGVTNYDDTDYGPNNDGVTDYDDTDYGPNNDGVTNYDDTDYGPNNDGVTNYDDTDYGPNNDGVTNYDDTDYGPNNDGVTNYDDTDYGPNNDGVTDYSSWDDGNSNYDDGGSNYDDGGSNYDDGGSDYDD